MLTNVLAQQPLVSGRASNTCRAVVVIPAKDEEANLVRCLDALARQTELDGRPFPAACFEIILLLNNCGDGSASVAKHWHTKHPEVNLHFPERCLPDGEAHVGTARRLLMDTACVRLSNSRARRPGILSTDADSIVAHDWIAQNLRALDHGADAVGGKVDLLPREYAQLPERIRACYEQDQHYARLIAQLEDLLDPQPGDPWPRHLDHFGSSLACTPEAYVLCGGMPAVGTLEDEAFVDRIRRADLVLRHDPSVKVFTSARLDGRTEIGLAGQFRLWAGLSTQHAHTVPSAEFLDYRFQFMRRLREIFATKRIGDLYLPSQWWKSTFAEALMNEPTCPGFLAAVYCDILIAESFGRALQQPISEAIHGLQASIATVQDVDRILQYA